MLRVTLYERVGCHLCAETYEALRLLGRRMAVEIDRVDIDRDEALRDRYTLRVPVIAANGRELDSAGLEDGAIARFLKEAPTR